MAPWWCASFGNAASRTHAAGHEAAEAVERARRQVAALVGADAREVIFTSGATEANNLALLGSARARPRGRDRVIGLSTEHRSVLDPLAELEREGLEVTLSGVGRDGLVDPESLAVDARTLLVSVMHANNEIGVVQDVAAIAARARRVGARVHCDAAQSAGKIEVDVRALDVDLMSLSAHKLYGPKGIGALIVRRRRPALAIAPLIRGGGHERGLRSGTLPVPLCVGFGAACEIALRRRADDARAQRELRERLWQGLESRIDGVTLHGDAERRLPGSLNVGFPVDAGALLAAVPDLALSLGSACSSAVPEPSHVLRALGLTPEQALRSVRLSVGRPTTRADVDRAVERLAGAVDQLRRRRRRR